MVIYIVNLPSPWMPSHLLAITTYWETSTSDHTLKYKMTAIKQNRSKILLCIVHNLVSYLTECRQVLVYSDIVYNRELNPTLSNFSLEPFFFLERLNFIILAISLIILASRFYLPYLLAVWWNERYNLSSSLSWIQLRVQFQKALVASLQELPWIRRIQL
jgi:hypothetical protein